MRPHSPHPPLDPTLVTFGRRAQLPVRPVFGSLFWASSAKQCSTNLVNDSVVSVVLSDDFSDISDGEVLSATQLIEELYGEDTDSHLVQPGKVSPGYRLFKRVRFLTLFAIIHFMTFFVYVKTFGIYL